MKCYGFATLNNSPSVSGCFVADLDSTIHETSPSISPVSTGEYDPAVRLLELLPILGHGARSPTAPYTFRIRIIHPIVSGVNLYFGIRANVVLELLDDGFAVHLILEMTVVAKPDTPGSVGAMRFRSIVVQNANTYGELLSHVANQPCSTWDSLK